MQLKVSVISDRPDEYVGKKGLVKSQIITCQDVDPSGYRLLMPFDYTVNEKGCSIAEVALKVSKVRTDKH